jgi:uncharacterized protein with PIN domain
MKELRFVTDAMLGKLTRWLRMLGHDVEYTRSTEDKTLIQKAKKENRILLTRDVELYRQAIAKGAETFLIENPDQTANLAQLAKRYGFKLKVEVKTSRCPKCNGKIKIIPKALVADKIPESTFSNYGEFWQCQNCAQIYWHGAHWKRIERTLTDARKALKT